MNLKSFFSVSDTIPRDGSEDVTSGLQKLIDENPNRTLFFPDGIYRISSPLVTPADPRKSVSLALSDFAVIRACEGWSSDEAMIRLGGSFPYNDISINGSNYSLTGGIIDGNGVADAISIESGRETSLRNISIKHARAGIRLKRGANSNSSDADITGVNIFGNGTSESFGVIVESSDNTFSDMRIANVYTGVKLCEGAGGNVLRNIHPLYYLSTYADYSGSCGFLDLNGNNCYYMCYSDQFSNGFRFGENAAGSILDSCMCYWYSSEGDTETAIRCDGQFRSAVTNIKVGFRAAVSRAVLSAVRPGGKGYLQNICLCHGDESLLGDASFRDYLRGTVL